jgi:predicted TPR repeat methyltransferase
VLVGAQEGYRLWSRSYDRDLNPVVALERRVVRELLGPLSGRCFLDVATGTGYWLNYARSRGARVYGVDLSAEMLAEAASKPGLKERLIRANMSALWDTFLRSEICFANSRGWQGEFRGA